MAARNPRALRFIAGLTSNLWFIPAVLTAASIALAGGVLVLDLRLEGGEWMQRNAYLLSGAEAANRLLAAIAASVISVAGVLFSITMLVMSNAAAQFGPRLLSNFMRHRGTHFVLGTYVGVFSYCLIVLRFAGIKEGFVPHIAVNVGLLLGLVGFFLLIYFIHHVTTFIRVANVIDDAARRMTGALVAFFPRSGGKDSPDEERATDLADDIDSRGGEIVAQRSGYLQLLDHDALLTLACEHDFRVHLHVRPGHFLLRGSPIATVSPPVDEALAQRIRKCVVTGVERSMDQDPEFAIQQLVEIALRALSPGVNEPFTAVNCLDNLAVAIAMVSDRRLPSRYLKDPAGETRIVLEPLTYAGVVDAAFDQIRQASQGNAAIVFRMLELLTELGRRDLPDALHAALRKQFDALREQNREGFLTRLDRDDYERRCNRAAAALAPSAPSAE